MGTTISGTNGVTFPDSTSMQTGQQACKAWVNFNGTGTVAIRAAYNVSSITDNGTGDYTVNFTTAMVDTGYCVTDGDVLNRNVSNAKFDGTGIRSTTQLQVYAYDGAAYSDFAIMQFSVFR